MINQYNTFNFEINDYSNCPEAHPFKYNLLAQHFSADSHVRLKTEHEYSLHHQRIFN